MKIGERSQKNIVGLLIIGAVSFAILSSPNTKKEETNTSNSAVNVSVNMEEKIFTIEKLSEYNGQNGMPAYIAVDGVVYDVTNAAGWKDGVHKKGIEAGKDLTKEILKSPHGKSVLKDLTVVGKLQ